MTKPRQLAPTVGPRTVVFVFLEGALQGSRSSHDLPDDERPGMKTIAQDQRPHTLGKFDIKSAALMSHNHDYRRTRLSI